MKTIDDIMQLIEEEDVEFIRLQFTDILGNLKNMAITPEQLGRFMHFQHSIDGSVMFDCKLDIDEEIYLVPDLDTFVILPWRPQQGKVGKLICDVYNADETPFEMSPRRILKKVLDQAKEEGYTFMVNPECEFFLFHTDENGNPTTISHEKAGFLDAGPVDLGENARRDMVLTLEEMGFEVESSHHEKASAQHEIDFSSCDAFSTADNLMTFKFAIRSIAKRFGLYATFMPKPRTDTVGSGMHMHFSMYKDGKNLFSPENGETVSEYAKYFMNGIIDHALGLCAITNPVVNSYKRIMAGYGAPNAIDWSTKSKKNILKLHNNNGNAKVEVRFPDPAANPYLAIAVCIAAGLDGVRRKAETASVSKNGKHLPGNLKDALRMLKKDRFLCDVLGDEYTKIYLELKTEEWNDYMMQVSDWEIARYLGKM